MNILETLKKLRDDLKLWVTNNLNALNTKIDEKTIPVDSKLSATSTNPVQNKTITNAINNIPKFSGDYNDLTNAPNIAEDESGEVIIADESGNIILKVDDKGLHTTAVSVNGDPAATQKYVDEAIDKIPDTDLTNYYTKEETDNIIESVKEEIGESILSEGEDIKVTDESGNIILQVDDEGLHTTELTLNGKSVKQIAEEAANEKMAEVVGESPELLDTLDELAAALGDDPNFATTVLEQISNKVDKVEGKDLSTNDFSNEYKERLDNLNNVDNTSDADKPVSTATQAALDDLKSELSETIVSESDSWKIVDEDGNIAFQVDETGAHTTNLTLNGKKAATEEYVDNAVANIEFPEPDLTDYATKKYVDDAIDAIPATDLTDYATKKYVDDAIDAIPETDLTNYYNKTETDTLVENSKKELSESIVSESDEWKVVDEAGNIIFSVDAEGAHTTSLTLNGQSVDDMIDDKVDKVDGKGLSTNDFTNEYKDKLDGLENITFEETDPTVPAWAKEETKPSYTADEVGALADTTVLADLTDDATHRTVTDTEKQAWNAKSDFSGDYNDLTNAPDISEDDSGDLIIADKDGNIIFRSNGNGFETVNLTVENLIVGGESVQSMIETYVDAAILGGEW